MAPAYKAPIVEAPPHLSGYLEIFGGWAKLREREYRCVTEIDTFCDTFNFEADGWVLGGAARANYWIASNMSVQVDAQGEGTSYKVDSFAGRDLRVSGHSYLLGGHLSWRDPGRGLFGGFVGAGDSNGARHLVVGGQAQFYWNDVTLYAQGGYNTTLNAEGDFQAWFGRLTGRYFINPNLVIEATGLYADGRIVPVGGMGPLEWENGRGFRTWAWEAKAEWRMPQHPFSFFVKYAGSQTDYERVTFTFIDETESTSSVVKDHRFLGGFRIVFADETLKATDRRGATLDIIAPLGLHTAPLGFGGRGGPL